MPFYLKENKPVIFRKTDPVLFESAISEARSRFEQKLKNEKIEN